MTAALEVRDLAVTRGGRRVLAVDHLAIEDGETLAIVGPNGAGKSTLLLALAGLLTPDSGSFTFRGASVTPTADLAYRRRIGLVLPAPLLLSASVFDNVAAGLRFRGLGAAETRDRVEHWLDRLAIAHLRQRAAARLSSGEAQRASLARALVLEPDVLFLDEPFVALDARTRADLLDDFERVGREGAATRVIVTHHLHEAARLGDRLAVLLDGTVRQCDTPARVEAQPVDGEVAALMRADARVRGHIVVSGDGLVVVDTGSAANGDAAARARRLLASLAAGTTAAPGADAPGGPVDVHEHGEPPEGA